MLLKTFSTPQQQFTLFLHVVRHLRGCDVARLHQQAISSFASLIIEQKCAKCIFFLTRENFVALCNLKFNYGSSTHKSEAQ